MGYIVLENVSKSYDGKNNVVDNLNLKIEKGNLETMLGPSGCGKSTILRIIAGFEKIDKGKIYINNEDVTNKDSSQRNIGMVFQQYSLFPTMTVKENIGFGLKMEKINKEEIDIRVSEIINIIELVGKENYYPNQLSGGQKQRVALARALITRPEVLLLDEPLSAIDALLRKNLQKAIRDIQKKLKITTLLVTHDQSEAMAISDSIHVMHKGKIVQSDKPSKVYINPKTYFVANFIGNYNILNSDEFFKLTGIKYKGHVAIRPETIESIIDKEAVENYHVLKVEIKDFYVNGNILSYVIKSNGVELRMDHLYRSFNLHKTSDILNVYIRKDNFIYL